MQHESVTNITLLHQIMLTYMLHRHNNFVTVSENSELNHMFSHTVSQVHIKTIVTDQA